MNFPNKLVYRVHAIKRMFERMITTEDIKNALIDPKILKEYDDDIPYPSYLVLGWVENRPIHIVAAVNSETKETIIITAYEPTLEEWNENFNGRKIP